MVHTRTRIKICGLTRSEDVQAAVAAGADAVGFVFYPPSARALSIVQAAALTALLPPFITSVGLFVNPEPDYVNEVLAAVPLQMLQFHGEETNEQCARYGRPWIKTLRMHSEANLLEFSQLHPGASGILLDAYVPGYGGEGKVFDWSMIPASFDRPLILAGGLDPSNVGEAVRRIRPWAVDVSSGVETEKGIKDAEKIAAFIAGVRHVVG